MPLLYIPPFNHKSSADRSSLNVDPYANKVSVLLLGNNTLLEEVSQTLATADVDLQFSTDKKFGTHSFYFPSTTTQRLIVPYVSSLNFGNSDFTVESWIKLPTGTASNSNIFLTRRASVAVYAPYSLILTPTYVRFLGSSNGTSWDLDFQVNITFPVDSWFHLAICRNGSTFKFFLNGTEIGSTTSTITIYSTADNLYFGSMGTSYPFKGFVDDFRITSGICRYLTNFIPSEYETTLNSSHVDYDPFYDNITLGLHMNGPSGLQAFSEIKGKTVLYEGSSQLSSSVVKFGNTSLRTGLTNNDVIYLNSSTDWNLGSTDFTISCWIYPLSTGTTLNPIIGQWSMGSASLVNNSILLQIDTLNKISFTVVTNGTTSLTISDTTNIPTNKWSYIEVIRFGSTVYIFKNGVSVASGSVSTGTVNSSTSPISIGRVRNSTDTGWDTTNGFNGYIDDIRITRGISRFPIVTHSSTLPFPDKKTDGNLVYDPYIAHVTAGLRLDDATDVTGKIVTNTGVIFDTNIVKTGTKSAYFKSDNVSYLSMDNSTGQNSFGTDDFTIECWYNMSSWVSTDPTIASIRKTSGSIGYGWRLFFNHSTNKLSFEMYDNNDSTATLIESTTLGGLGHYNIWNHVAVVRKGTVVKIFVNGILQGSTTISSTFNIVPNSTTPFEIGSSVISEYFTGYLDDFRITKLARYSANFFPLTDSFPYSTNILSSEYGKKFPTDQHLNNVELFIGFDNEVLNDATGKHKISYVGSLPKLITQPVVQDGAVYFNGGTTGYVTYPVDASLELGSSDFTIECWVYMNSTQTYGTAIFMTPSNVPGYAGVALGISSQSVTAYLSFDGVDWSVGVSMGTIQLNTWTHVAVTRSGGNIFGFLQGKRTILTSSAGTLSLFTGTLPGRLGFNAGHVLMSTAVDNFRITKGVARYTNNFNPTIN